MRSVNYCPNINMEMIFLNTENSKMSERHKFVYNLSQKLDLKSSNKAHLEKYKTTIQKKKKKKNPQNNSSNVE